VTAEEGSDPKKTLPKFANLDEMAEFFDRTDTDELEWEDAGVRFERPEMVHISVRIPKDDLVAIKKAARELGLGYTAFIRMILRRAVAERGRL